MRSDQPATAPTLTAAQVADRMGLTTRQLQDLRLRGIGPQIVQHGLSIHYEQTDVKEIERHEAMLLVEQVLASDRPLTLLRALVDLAGFKRSPILQQVNPPPVANTSEPQSTTVAPGPAKPDPPIFISSPELTIMSASGKRTSPADSALSKVSTPESKPLHPAAPAALPAPTAPTAPSLTVVPSDTTAWHLVYTKAQMEDIALLNLERQGYECYLPQMRIERVRRRKTKVATEPMFPRYLFVRLDSSDQGKSWSPIRSTLGVSQLVHFGARAAKVDDDLLDLLRQREQAMPLDAKFRGGDSVVITDGPFAGIEAIYQTADAERRAFILLEILSAHSTDRGHPFQADRGQRSGRSRTPWVGV